VAEPKAEVQIGFAWWLRPYLYLLVFFCLLHRQPPDSEKLHQVLRRAVRMRLR
jgi:hypothetical protein